MSSLPIEGRISIKPFSDVRHGACGATPPIQQLSQPGDSTQNAAIAELSTLISSLGALSAQAQSLPLTPPTLPGLPQGGYQPQTTDYTQFADDAD